MEKRYISTLPRIYNNYQIYDVEIQFDHVIKQNN